MNKLLILGFMLISSIVHATCGDLDIKVVNNSNQNCIFKNKVIYYGTLPNHKVPAVIYAHEFSPFFNASQDGSGIGVLLTYICGNDMVKFYSWQEYCSYFGGAGRAGGQPQESSTLNLDFDAKTGSLITGRPGQIIWRIS